MPITVVGSIAYDAVKTPFGERERMLGGAAVHFALAASFFEEVRVVGPVGEDFGEARLLAAICNNWHADTRDLCDAVLWHLRSFLGDLDPQDDQTLMIIRPQPSQQRMRIAV